MEKKDRRMEFRPLTPEYDAPLAALIRSSLKARGLDIPGTAYFDEALDRLSAYYDRPGRGYWILAGEDGALLGGIGLAELRGSRCELQKLYLAENAQGRGLSYDMIRWIEEKAREKGYRSIYLETHTNLQAAIHVYERAGYRQIPKPEDIVHSTMNRFYLKEL